MTNASNVKTVKKTEKLHLKQSLNVSDVSIQKATEVVPARLQ